ncbi:MAG: hypothetical protein WC757_01765 [Candidatus Paceibacterota bacterium]|jgi:UDP-glucose 6-dehydrogenase
MVIGFIGQGWIGKNYARDFENRGFTVTRYSKEPEYIDNKEDVRGCHVVFIAVPTPTTPEGFDSSIVAEAISLVGKGNIAVIKSTVLPGVTLSLQRQFPDVYVMHSPEFLTEATAMYDAENPKRNIVGIPYDTSEYMEKAQLVLDILPRAPYEKICGSLEAEFIKYGRNVSGFVRVVLTNLLYDAVKESGGNWQTVRDAMIADPDNGPTYMNPIHKTGRGAGGHCFIKDFAAFKKLYEAKVGDEIGNAVLDALERKNIDLLVSTRKDLDLLEGVYGDAFTEKSHSNIHSYYSV